MWITKDYQRKWIWTMILNEFSRLTKDEECYCLPYIHLEDFYSKIWFRKINNKHAPLFLQKRLERYKYIEKFSLMIMKKD
jgi:UDP-galactopyranose mutase